MKGRREREKGWELSRRPVAHLRLVCVCVCLERDFARSSNYYVCLSLCLEWFLPRSWVIGTSGLDCDNGAETGIFCQADCALQKRPLSNLPSSRGVKFNCALGMLTVCVLKLSSLGCEKEVIFVVALAVLSEMCVNF